jgi:hypothetical protein
MVVEVDDEHAEIWTKPSGWLFDPAQATAGLGGHFSGVFLAAFASGDTRALPLDHPNLPALFTRVGGEVVTLKK